MPEPHDEVDTWLNVQVKPLLPPPGTFEHGLPAVYYVSPPDPTWSRADQAAYLPGVKRLLFTTVHGASAVSV